jgi:hypothetical protein
VLLSVVSFSGRQIVHAYPWAAGPITPPNWGDCRPAAAAALLIDYVMTVAVSIAAGSLAPSALIASGHGSQLTATQRPTPFLNLNVVLSLFFIGLIMFGNLRGIRVRVFFSIPTYLFIVDSRSCWQFWRLRFSPTPDTGGAPPCYRRCSL